MADEAWKRSSRSSLGERQMRAMREGRSISCRLLHLYLIPIIVTTITVLVVWQYLEAMNEAQMEMYRTSELGQVQMQKSGQIPRT